MSTKSRSIVVKGTVVTIATRNENDYISLSDMVRDFEGQGALIEQWLKVKDTVLFLGVWEQLNNPAFNSLEFEGIRNEAGRNSFFLSVKRWAEKTGAIGVYASASAGRYGGTYAHRDIAFEFGSWLSPEFKLYLIKEFQRLKDDEAARTSREWSFQRTLAKVNYRIHTDAIQERLIPPALTKSQIAFVYASEADLLNVALFGKTAAEWRKENPKLPDRSPALGHRTTWRVAEQLRQLPRVARPPSRGETRCCRWSVAPQRFFERRHPACRRTTQTRHICHQPLAGGRT